MKPIFRWVAGALLALAAAAAQAQTCTPVAGAASAAVADIFGASVDVQGSVTFSCSRPQGNPRFPATFWIGVSGANGARNLVNGANNLQFQLFTTYTACSTAWEGTTGVTLANALTANNDFTLTNLTVPFCLRVPSGQVTARPLTYTGSATLTVRSLSSTGYLWGTGTLSLTATVDPRCVFSTVVGILPLAYTSFQAGATTNSKTFDVRCTNSTSYSLALDTISATALGLSYTLGLNTLGVQSLGSLAGTGNAQTYTFHGSIAGGQSGVCANPAGCSTTDSRSLTITY